MIRWVPSAVLLVSYFANLMLISSFLGIGLGAMAASQNRRLFRFFPLALLLCIGFIFLCRSIYLPGSQNELRYFAQSPSLVNHLVLVGIFTINVMVFIPLGEGIGQLFHRLPPLRAYAWDLSGSLVGTLCFGAFSFLAFSPFWGLLGVAGICLVLSNPKNRIWAAIPLIIALFLLTLTTERGAIWSPYHYITVHTQDGALVDLSNVPESIREMKNPPVYIIRVNQKFVQPHMTMAAHRFDPTVLAGVTKTEYAAEQRAHYFLPYFFKPKPKQVAVVGAGGGSDVEAALLNGANTVDAVEIDPQLINLSRKINASGVYDDSRVNVITNDARAFLQQTSRKYDLIVFGYLDSQALFSSMSNVRLDGYVYTVESISAAFNRLQDDGNLALSFYVADRIWLVDKLVGMVSEATGTKPLIYSSGTGNVTLLSFRNPPQFAPAKLNDYQRLNHKIQGVPISTDDWPYLYLAKRGVPSDYLTVIGTLLILAFGGVLFLMPRGTVGGKIIRIEGTHFFAMGLGFLLLQTKTIINSSLYFGATWIVTTAVITGVLLMVLLANFLAQNYLKKFSLWFYAPLFISLLALYAVPTSIILELPILGRLLWTIFVTPLPIFFAGLIFSTTFKKCVSPSASFGANLIGATIGGFLEYHGMAIGHNSLTLYVIAAYLGSLFIMYSKLEKGKIVDLAFEQSGEISNG
jgi:hypothetical protein